jgi:hypothetical protein
MALLIDGQPKKRCGRAKVIRFHFFAHWHSLICGSAHPEAAIECLRNALRAAPDYIDAMFNFALLLTFRARRSSFAMIRVALGMSDSKCAGRPARSRWCKSTTMKE